MAKLSLQQFRAQSASSLLNSKSNNSTGKFVDSITNKSATEISDSVQESMKKDPLKFAGLRYPLDIGSEGLGHYVIFYCISNNFGSGTSSDKVMAARVGLAKPIIGRGGGGRDTGDPQIKDLRVNQQGVNPGSLKSNNSVISKFPTHSVSTGAIALYLPPGVKVSYGMTYDVEPTDLSGQLLGTIGEARNATGAFEKAKTLGMGVIGGAATELGKAVGDLFGNASIGDPVKLGSKALGIAINPHEEQFFNKPNFRSFTYTFNFWPRSPEEVKKVDDIIFLFKYHAHPELDMNSETGGRYFRVPSEFEIHYAYLDRENEYLNKISKCVLKQVDVEYGPSEQFSTFEGLNDPKGAPPVT